MGLEQRQGQGKAEGNKQPVARSIFSSADGLRRPIVSTPIDKGKEREVRAQQKARAILYQYVRPDILPQDKEKIENEIAGLASFESRVLTKKLLDQFREDNDEKLFPKVTHLLTLSARLVAPDELFPMLLDTIASQRDEPLIPNVSGLIDTAQALIPCLPKEQKVLKDLEALFHTICKKVTKGSRIEGALLIQKQTELNKQFIDAILKDFLASRKENNKENDGGDTTTERLYRILKMVLENPKDTYKTIATKTGYSLREVMVSRMILRKKDYISEKTSHVEKPVVEKPRPIILPAQRAAIKEYLLNNWDNTSETSQKIAKRFGVSPSTVNALRNELNLPKKRRPSRSPAADKMRAALPFLWREKSKNQIAKQFGVTIKTVTRAIERLELEAEDSPFLH